MQLLPFDQKAADIFDDLVRQKLGQVGTMDLRIAAIAIATHPSKINGVPKSPLFPLRSPRLCVLKWTFGSHNLLQSKKGNAMQINDITQATIGAAIEVHRQLGPGLLQSAYRVCASAF